MAVSKIRDGGRLGKSEVNKSVIVSVLLIVGSIELSVVADEGVLVVVWAFSVGKSRTGGVVNSYPGLLEGNDR